MKYLICYDISEPKRLYRVAKGLNGMGYRVQKSFFTCELSKDEYTTIKDLLLNYIDEKEDRLAIYKVCDRCAEGGYYLGCSISQFFADNYQIL